MRLFCDSLTAWRGETGRDRGQTDLGGRHLLALELDEARVQVVQLLAARGLLRRAQQQLGRHVGELGDALLRHEDAAQSG